MATVLLAIQQWPLLEQIRSFLEASGYRVVEAAAVGTALQILNELCDVELLLSDAHGAHAADLASQATASRAGVKVLLISGEPDFVNRELIPQRDVGFIEKPFAWCELEHSIERLLRSHAAEQRSKPRTLTASSHAS